MKIGQFITLAVAKLIQPDEDGTYRIKVREDSTVLELRSQYSSFLRKSIFSITIRATNLAGQLSVIGAVGLNPYIQARFR